MNRRRYAAITDGCWMARGAEFDGDELPVCDDSLLGFELRIEILPLLDD